jgi:hypothetical protein
MAELPGLCVGYEHRDPGPAPRSTLLNDPPALSVRGDFLGEYQRWRAVVERDEARLAAQHAQLPVWFRVMKHGSHAIVPIMGGTPWNWDSIVAGITVSAIDTGFESIRIANLSQWPVFGSLRDIGRKAKRASLRFDYVSSSGSTLEPFAGASASELASFIVDVIRASSDAQGRRDAAREKSDLVSISGLLLEPISVIKLTAALDVALGATTSSTTSAVTKSEERLLRDYYHNVIAKRPSMSERLDGLHADLRELVRYTKDANQQSVNFGIGSARVAALDIAPGMAVHETELARQLVANLVTRAFTKPSLTHELLMVLGAERLDAPILDLLKRSAEQLDKQLVLFFGEITPAAQRTLGAGGSNLSMFLRLTNADDAEVAARHFGREFTFVVDGISIADGKTSDWSSSKSLSTSVSSTHNRSFFFEFGAQLSKTLGEADTQTHGQSSGISQTFTKAMSRTHDFVIQPEEFQRLPEDMVLLADERQAVLASCDYRLRNHRLSSNSALTVL